MPCFPECQYRFVAPESPLVFQDKFDTKLGDGWTSVSARCSMPGTTRLTSPKTKDLSPKTNQT